MKTALHPLIILCFLVAQNNIEAQKILCNSFSVKEIQMDAFHDHMLNVTVYFTGHDADFITYPYVSLITDQDGDTIGTGELNSFGQFGNTDRVYQVSTHLDALPTNLKANVYFHYDTIACALNYPASTTGINDSYNLHQINVYPNPFKTSTTIQTDMDFINMTLLVFNSFGQQVKQVENINGNILTLDRDHLADGIYFLHFIQENKRVATGSVVIQE